MNQKGFTSILIILGIILIIGIIIGTYYLGNSGIFKSQSKVAKPKATTITPSPIPVKKPVNIIFLRKNNLWIADIDGSNQRQLTNTNNAPGVPSEAPFKQIPNSTKIVYMVFSSIGNKLSDSLNILDLNTKETMVIHNFSLELNRSYLVYLEFDVSANGEKIVYMVGLPFNGPSDDDKVFIYDIKTGTEKVITAKYLRSIISPDGKRLISLGADNNINIFNIDDQSYIPLTNYKNPQDPIFNDPKAIAKFEDVMNDSLVWSPDGQKIIYSFGNFGHGWPVTDNIRQVDINSKEDVALTYSGINETNQLLDQDDSSNIYYLSIESITLDPSGKPAPKDLYIGYDLSQQGYKVESKARLKKFNKISKQTTILKELPSEFAANAASHWQFDSGSQKFLYSKMTQPYAPDETRIFDVNAQQDSKLMDDAFASQWIY